MNCILTFSNSFKNKSELCCLKYLCYSISEICIFVSDQKELLTCIANIFRVNRIAQQGKIQSDDHRTPSVKMLLGEDSRVTQVDNKIR